MEKFKSVSSKSDKSTSSGVLYDIEVIKQDIVDLIMMRKGDIPQDNAIGCIIHDYVFHPKLNPDEEAEIIEDMTAQLLRDPRLSNINIHVYNFEEDLTVAIYADVTPLHTSIQLTVPIKEQATNV